VKADLTLIRMASDLNEFENFEQSCSGQTVGLEHIDRGQCRSLAPQ
jgi:hypothetical protein